MRLTEKQLHRIINESVLKLLREYDAGTLNLDANTSLDLKFIERDEILANSDDIWDILVLSYEGIGGLKTYRSKQDFLKKVRYAKVVYCGDELVACAIYRNMEDSFKMVAIGCNQEEIGKQGIQAIIKDDIDKLDFHFWAEVSGAIEHYFRKYNGYPMPNMLASDILQISPEKIRLSNKDMVHYERVIADEWFEKMIYGAKSEDVFKAAMAAVDDYSTFMKEVNQITEDAGTDMVYTPKQAMYIIENIYRAHEEDGFNELVPSWYNALLKAKETLKRMEPSRTVRDYLEYCNYLLETMPLLELHPLNF